MGWFIVGMFGMCVEVLLPLAAAGIVLFRIAQNIRRKIESR